MIPEISIGEFLLFSVIALIIINPDDWPKVLRKVGYYYGQVHDFIMETRKFTRKTYDDIVLLTEPTGDDEIKSPHSDADIEPPALAEIDFHEASTEDLGTGNVTPNSTSESVVGSTEDVKVGSDLEVTGDVK